MTSASKRLLAGRTIVDFDARPFDAARPGYRERAHDPIITLDNGARLTFTVEETEVGTYGVSVNYHPPR